MRDTFNIIQDILGWRTSYDGLSLEEHLRTELSKLDQKTRKSPTFREQYISRAGNLPTTIIEKLDDSLYLLNKLRSGDLQMSDRDKTIVSDILEFIIVPFYHFATSANRTLSPASLLDEVVVEMGEHGANLAVRTRQKLECNIRDYERLGNLFIELCDGMECTIPNNIRNFTNTPPQSFRDV